jgi:hypothetical protein
MRYRSPHVARGGPDPFALLGTKYVRTILSAAAATAIVFTPAMMQASPAMAAPVAADLTFGAVTPVTEGGLVTVSYSYIGDGETYAITTAPSGNGATAGSDYTAPGGTLVLAAGSVGSPVTGSITIQTTDDQLYEGAETFDITATAAPDSETATATINDNDSKPSYSLSASPGTVTEGAGAKSTITATLSAVSGVAATVALTTTNGTATAGVAPLGDYTALTGGGGDTITIPPGSLTGTKDVLITNDGVKDSQDTESFTVTGAGTNTLQSAASTTVSVKDAQPTPKLTLSGGGASAEGGAAAVFTVTTDTKSELPITVQWDAVDVTPAAGDGTATPGTDFSYPASRIATISAGSTSTTITIAPTVDGLDELTEDYAIQLSNPTNAALGTAIKVGATISDNAADLPPTMTITPTAVTEGDSGKKAQTFTAILSGPSGKTVKASYSTGGGTATAGKDYVAATGTLTFPPGTTTQTFSVDIIGDTVDEGAGETFVITPAAIAGESPASFSAVGGAATVTITDDDAAPTIASFDDKSVTEGNDTSVILLPLKLSNASNATITFNLTDTPSGTNMASNVIGAAGTNDYTLLNPTIVIPPDTTTGYAAILINGDTYFEPDETSTIAALATMGSQTYLTAPFTKSSVLTIVNDDKAPNLKINNISGDEGGTVDVTGTLTGMSAASTVYNVWFTGQSVGGKKAADPTDFTNPGVVQVTVGAGTAPTDTLAVASLALTDDTTNEPDETINVTGNTTGNTGTVTDGAVTIKANDGAKPGEPGGLTISGPANIVGAVAVSIKGKAAASTMVDLYGAPMGGGGELKKLLSTTSDADGNYMFSRWIGEGYRFAAMSGDEKSDEIKVTVTQNPVFVASSGATGMLTLAVQGNPRGPGQTAIVQRWVNGAWVNAWRGTTGSDNIWRGTAKVASKTTVTLRAFVAGYTPDGLLPGYTAAKKVTIK